MSSAGAQGLKQRLKAEASRLGFSHCGVTEADGLGEPTEQRFAQWIENGYGGGMAYLKREPRRRARPRELLPGARSVVCLAARYAAHNPENPQAPPRGWSRVARYARGRDYHLALDAPLKQLEAWLQAERGEGARTRRFCDAGPLLERQFAQRAGLGFIGKNTLLIAPGAGSWIVLAAIVTSLEIEPDEPGLGTCGACVRCLEACPASAFPEPYVLDARRCISSLTIEKRGEFTEQEARSIGHRLFGCDVCQEVCPYNKRPCQPSFPELDETRFPDGLFRLADLLAFRSNRPFERAFAGSPLLRPRLKGLRRNAAAVAANQGDPALADLLKA